MLASMIFKEKAYKKKRRLIGGKKGCSFPVRFENGPKEKKLFFFGGLKNLITKIKGDGIF
jgi:hypothetical protein